MGKAVLKFDLYDSIIDDIVLVLYNFYVIYFIY